MAGPNFTLIPHDWINLEHIINDLCSRIINEDTSFTDYLLADGTRELIGNWDAGAFHMTALNFVSDVASGTSPYACTSTTVNANLNADLWDGYQFADYLDQAVKQASSPAFAGLTVDNITINGAMITSDTGIVSFVTTDIQTGGKFILGSPVGNRLEIKETIFSMISAGTYTFKNFANNQDIDFVIFDSGISKTLIQLDADIATVKILEDLHVNSANVVGKGLSLRGSGTAGTTKGGLEEWIIGESSLAGYTYAAAGKYVWKSTKQSSPGDIGVASINFTDGAFSCAGGDFDVDPDGNIIDVGDITSDGTGSFVDLVVAKTSGVGIKVDQSSPTFGFADMLGYVRIRTTGANRPSRVQYNGGVSGVQFTNGDKEEMEFHFRHDYAAGTDIHLHIHWSQNGAGATSGTVTFKYSAVYAKAHNQNVASSSFTSTPITASFTTIDINDGGSGLNQYQQFLTEVTISAATATAALFDRDDFEPDGLILMTLEMETDNLVNASSPFIHFVDIHYQTTGVIGTKQKAPDFYT